MPVQQNIHRSPLFSDVHHFVVLAFSAASSFFSSYPQLHTLQQLVPPQMSEKAETKKAESEVHETKAEVKKQEPKAAPAPTMSAPVSYLTKVSMYLVDLQGLLFIAA